MRIIKPSLELIEDLEEIPEEQRDIYLIEPIEKSYRLDSLFCRYSRQLGSIVKIMANKNKTYVTTDKAGLLEETDLNFSCPKTPEHKKRVTCKFLINKIELENIMSYLRRSDIKSYYVVPLIKIIERSMENYGEIEFVHNNPNDKELKTTLARREMIILKSVINGDNKLLELAMNKSNYIKRELILTAPNSIIKEIVKASDERNVKLEH